MPIFYDAQKETFHLTDGTHFSFILKTALEPDGVKSLLNPYWGPALGDADLSYLDEDNKRAASFDSYPSHNSYAYPTRGRGDPRPVALTATGIDGARCCVLTYQGHAVAAGKPRLPGLPAVYVESDAEAETLSIRLQDGLTGLFVTLRYTVMKDLHALTSSVIFENQGRHPITLENPASACATLRGAYDMLHLHGAWAKERAVERVPSLHGIREINSSRGASGHHHNPFMALLSPDATEHHGDCYAMNFVYSGSFRMQAEENEYGYTRMLGGLNECFWRLSPGETLHTPEMVMVYSGEGLNGMSHIFHKLYRTRLCRGLFRDTPRPVLVNNWEGTRFLFDHQKLLAIAEKAADVGIELFVLDDGWFGKRNQDNCSLGDWVVNEEKLPGGLAPLVEKINAMGLKFGLWFEPEMISPDSDLYRAHPDWCLHVPGRYRNQQRNQLILDMSRRDVQDYIIEAVSSVLDSARIEYVKWDMNRNFTEVGSALLSAEHQGEVHHRYMLGLYRVLEAITSRFPRILFESCSGGGGRFDAGMLYYMPQTWTSDDSDAVERLFIQYGTSMAYPVSAMGAHVTAVPNHQVGRRTTLEMRGHVAMSGNFGYELDMSLLNEEELAEMRKQVSFVKEIRTLTQQGRFTRLASPFEGSLAAWQFSNDTQSEILVCLFRRYASANSAAAFIKVKDIDENRWYVDQNGQEYHGSVLRHVGLRPIFTGPSAKRMEESASQILHLKAK